MKKILLFISVLVSINAFSQTNDLLYGRRTVLLNGYNLQWANGSADSILSMYTTKMVAFKPFVMGTYAHASLPSAASFSGAWVFDSDSLKPAYSNGSNWIYPTTGGGGGGGTPGGNTTDIQFNSAGTFGGSDNHIWDNTNFINTVITPTTANTYYPSFKALNTATASSGNQMQGGLFVSEGNGWKTTATAASQEIGFRWGTLPVQGAANPTAYWSLQGNVNSGSYYDIMKVYNSGASGGAGQMVFYNTSANGLGIYFAAGTNVTSNFLTIGARSDWNLSGAGISARAAGWTVYGNVTAVDPNSYTSAVWNSISTTIAQGADAYDPTHYTLRTTNSSGNYTIAPSGGTVTVTGNLTLGTAGNALTITEGSNGRVGQTVMVAGTKAITITGLTTSSRAFVQFVAQGGTSTGIFQYKAVCTANTLTITAVDWSGAIINTDTSTLNYFVIN